VATAPRQASSLAPTANKWLITASIMFGTVLSVMDVSIVNVAMPHMMGSFSQDLLTITWVSTSYSIAEMIMITMAAWWSALFGRKRLFLASMILFTTGSVLAGTSQTFAQMLLWRVVQGTGGGSLIPCAQAILRETFPPAEQGMAMAIYGMGVLLAPAAGPVIGGLLVDNYGWRWVFYVNVPFCVAGILMVLAFVRDPPYLKRGLQRVDWSGIALLSVGLTAMQIVLERGQEVDWFASRWVLGGTVVAVLALGALVARELLTNEPIINFRLLANRELAIGSALGGLLGFVLYGSTFLIPQLTQDQLGYSAYQAGISLMPRALAMLTLMPILGWIYNFTSPRLLTLLGFFALVASQWQLSHLSLDIGFYTLVLPLLLMGAGMGLSMVPLSTLSLSTISRTHMTDASGLYTLSRRIAGNLAYALLATVIARREQFHRAALIPHLTNASHSYLLMRQGLAARLLAGGYSAPDAAMRAVAIVNRTLNQQATMMAYNDANWISLLMALAVLPLIFLLPKRPPLGGGEVVSE